MDGLSSSSGSPPSARGHFFRDTAAAEALLACSFAKLSTQADVVCTSCETASKRSLLGNGQDESGYDDLDQTDVDAHLAIALATPTQPQREPPNSPLKTPRRYSSGHERTKSVLKDDRNEALTSSPLPAKRLKGTSWGSLYAGALFNGHQRSGRSSYRVGVEILSVSSQSSTMTGLIHIHNLTPTHPILTTFFDAEIIGPRHDFLTGQWDATKEIDEQHWSRFKALSERKSGAAGHRFTAPQDLDHERYIFMRWKEHCVISSNLANTKRRLFGSSRSQGSTPAVPVPLCTSPSRADRLQSPDRASVPDIDHYGLRTDPEQVAVARTAFQSQCIQGASFAGFYYVCFDRKEGSIEGYYWHQTSEMFQHLSVSSGPACGKRRSRGVMHESYELR